MKRLNLLIILVCLLCGLSFAAFAVADEAVWQPPPPVEMPVKNGVLVYDVYNTAAAINYADGRSLTLGADAEYSSIGPPVVSPDKTRVAYLEPYEFEEYSTIYVLDVVSGNVSVIEIPGIPYAFTAKRLAWLSDSLLLVTIGFGDGTVTAGGDLWYYDFASGASAKIMEAKGKEINAIRMDNDAAHLRMIGNEYYFTVKNYVMILRDDYTEVVPLAVLRHLIAHRQLLVIPEYPETRAAMTLQCLAGWLLGVTLEKLGADPVAMIVKKNVL